MKGRCVTVRDLTTGKTYRSLNEAAGDLFVSPPSLQRAWKKGRSECAGIPVEFAEGSRYGNEKPIKCVETGEEFPSLEAASKAVSRCPASISKAIKRCGCCAGYHWRYV